MTLQEVRGNGAISVRPDRWRFDSRQTSAQAPDDLPSALAALFDGQFGAADVRPNLLAVHVAADRHEGLGTGWHDANVVTALHRIGDAVALGLRLEIGDVLIG